MQRNKDKGGDVGLRREERSTRGKRMRAALEDESEGDQEFWNQEFWAEEAVDEDFKSEEEKEEEDVPDSDFDEPEDDDEDEEVEEKPMKDDAPKRKAPKAPEIKAPPRPRAPPKPKPTPAEREAQAEAKLAALEAVEAPTLRKSTKARTMEAAKERQVRVQSAPRRATPRSRANWQPLTQADLLAEAARTEVENIQSLKLLMAMEEATKRKAAVVKQHYAGPLVKFVSKRRLKEVQPGQEDPHHTHTAPAAPGQPSPPKTAPAAPQTGQPQTGHPSVPTPAPAPSQTPRGAVPQTPTPGAPPVNGPTLADPASPARPSQPSETPGVGGEAAGPSGTQTPAPAAAAAGRVQGSNLEGNTEAGGAHPATTTSTPASGMDIDGGSGAKKRDSGQHQATGGANTATPMSGMDIDNRDGGGDRPQADGTAGEQGGGGEDAADAAEAAAAKAAKDLENDGRRYEGTVSYEICNMPYPPMWLRRFRALPPPPLHKCAITGMPARYKDPATGQAYANPAAFRRLHPERQITTTQPLPLDQVRLTSSSSVQGEPASPPEMSCSSGGGADLMGGSLVRGSSRLGGAGVLQGCRAFLNAAAHTSSQLLPPEPDVLPEPSTHFPLLPPMALPQDMVALVTELHGPA